MKKILLLSSFCFAIQLFSQKTITSENKNENLEPSVKITSADLRKQVSKDMGQILGNGTGLSNNSIQTEFDKDESKITGNLLFQLSEKTDRLFLSSSFSAITDDPIYRFKPNERINVEVSGTLSFLTSRDYREKRNKQVFKYDTSSYIFHIKCLPLECKDSISEVVKLTKNKQEYAYKQLNWLAIHADYNNAEYAFLDTSIIDLDKQKSMLAISGMTYGVSFNGYYKWDTDLWKSRPHSLFYTISADIVLDNNANDLQRVGYTDIVKNADTTSTRVVFIQEKDYRLGTVEYERKLKLSARAITEIRNQVYFDFTFSRTAAKNLTGDDKTSISDKALLGFSGGLAFYAADEEGKAKANFGMYLQYDDIFKRPGLVIKANLPLNFGI